MSAEGERASDVTTKIQNISWLMLDQMVIMSYKTHQKNTKNTNRNTKIQKRIIKIHKTKKDM